MDSILKKLLESDLLSEETKAELNEQFKTAVDAYLAEERSKLEVEIRSTLTEEFVKAREELAETVDTKIDEYLTAEFDELKEDINSFRDLEVEYAEKLVEEKERLAQLLGEQLNQLVDKLDAFLEVRLDEEMSELKEDIEDVKKLEFGRKIFEAVETEFKKFRKEDLSTVEADLAETLDKLDDAENRLAEIENSRLAEARNGKLEELLAPLSGNAREQMKIILSNVATEKLEEAYKVYIGRVLKEAIAAPKEDVAKPIVESKPAAAAKPATMVTGNEEALVEDVDVDANKLNDAQLSRIRKLAGVK
jgi:predicted transcriptional regulator